MNYFFQRNVLVYIEIDKFVQITKSCHIVINFFSQKNYIRDIGSFISWFGRDTPYLEGLRDIPLLVDWHAVLCDNQETCSSCEED